MLLHGFLARLSFFSLIENLQIGLVAKKPGKSI